MLRRCSTPHDYPLPAQIPIPPGILFHQAASLSCHIWGVGAPPLGADWMRLFYDDLLRGVKRCWIALGSSQCQLWLFARLSDDIVLIVTWFDRLWQWHQPSTIWPHHEIKLENIVVVWQGCWVCIWQHQCQVALIIVVCLLKLNYVGVKCCQEASLQNLCKHTVISSFTGAIQA